MFQPYLKFRRKSFNSLLNHPAPVQLHREVKDISLKLLNQNKLLLIRSKLEVLLNHVITVLVIHQWVDFGGQLIKNHLLLIGIDALQFLLDKPGAMLISGKLQHMATDIFKLKLNVNSAELLHDRAVIRLAGISSIILLWPVTARRRSHAIVVCCFLGAAALST